MAIRIGDRIDYRIGYRTGHRIGYRIQLMSARLKAICSGVLRNSLGICSSPELEQRHECTKLFVG